MQNIDSIERQAQQSVNSTSYTHSSTVGHMLGFSPRAILAVNILSLDRPFRIVDSGMWQRARSVARMICYVAFCVEGCFCLFTAVHDIRHSRAKRRTTAGGLDWLFDWCFSSPSFFVMGETGDNCCQQQYFFYLLGGRVGWGGEDVLRVLNTQRSIDLLQMA